MKTLGFHGFLRVLQGVGGGCGAGGGYFLGGNSVDFAVRGQVDFFVLCFVRFVKCLFCSFWISL